MALYTLYFGRPYLDRIVGIVLLMVESDALCAQPILKFEVGPNGCLTVDANQLAYTASLLPTIEFDIAIRNKHSGFQVHEVG